MDFTSFFLYSYVHFNSVVHSVAWSESCLPALLHIRKGQFMITELHVCKKLLPGDSLAPVLSSALFCSSNDEAHLVLITEVELYVCMATSQFRAEMCLLNTCRAGVAD